MQNLLQSAAASAANIRWCYYIQTGCMVIATSVYLFRTIQVLRNNKKKKSK